MDGYIIEDASYLPSLGTCSRQNLKSHHLLVAKQETYALNFQSQHLAHDLEPNWPCFSCRPARTNEVFEVRSGRADQGQTRLNGRCRRELWRHGSLQVRIPVLYMQSGSAWVLPLQSASEPVSQPATALRRQSRSVTPASSHSRHADNRRCKPLLPASQPAFSAFDILAFPLSV